MLRSLLTCFSEHPPSCWAHLALPRRLAFFFPSKKQSTGFSGLLNAADRTAAPGLVPSSPSARRTPTPPRRAVPGSAARAACQAHAGLPRPSSAPSSPLPQCPAPEHTRGGPGLGSHVAPERLGRTPCGAGGLF